MLLFVGCCWIQLGFGWAPTFDNPTRLSVEEFPLGVNSNVVMVDVNDPAMITRDVAAAEAEEPLEVEVDEADEIGEEVEPVFVVVDEVDEVDEGEDEPATYRIIGYYEPITR